jgi:hypothetical protein
MRYSEVEPRVGDTIIERQQGARPREVIGLHLSFIETMSLRGEGRNSQIGRHRLGAFDLITRAASSGDQHRSQAADRG